MRPKWGRLENLRALGVGGFEGGGCEGRMCLRVWIKDVDEFSVVVTNFLSHD